MRLLLDTQIALWALIDSPRLSVRARELILDADNDIYVSVASVWEIAIKHALGRGDMPVSASRAAALFQAAGYLELPVTTAHAVKVESLPKIHGDPFDRILLAQALVEPLHLLTADRVLEQYGGLIERV